MEYARPAVALIDEGLEAARDLGVVARGRLRINVPRPVLRLITNRLLPEFFDAYPNIELEMVGDDQSVDIISAGFDAGIRISDLVQKDMVAVQLTKPEPLLLVGATSYFERYGKPRHPRDLNDARGIVLQREGRNVGHWDFVVGQRKVTVQPKGILFTNDVDNGIDAAIRGIGLICAPQSFLHDHITAGRLEPALQSFADEFPGLSLYYPSPQQSLPKLKAFVTFARKRMRDYPAMSDGTLDTPPSI